jgi:hypothetical protein
VRRIGAACAREDDPQFLPRALVQAENSARVIFPEHRFISNRPVSFLEAMLSQEENPKFLNLNPKG